MPFLVINQRNAQTHLPTCLISAGSRRRSILPSNFSKEWNTMRAMFRFNPRPTASLATSTSKPERSSVVDDGDGDGGDYGCRGRLWNVWWMCPRTETRDAPLTVEQPRLLPPGLGRQRAVHHAAPDALRRGDFDLALELEELAPGEGHHAVPRLDVLAPVLDRPPRRLERAQPLVAPHLHRVARLPGQSLDQAEEGGRAAQVELGLCVVMGNTCMRVSVGR